ncbi:MAG: DNA recombination protein RmuC [Propionibacteriaceae bacterium]|jgi:DNA recombination protein RmuC|nr:DNA recombination protein RmuC [Propionibacteriaceae bacterium]
MDNWWSLLLALLIGVGIGLGLALLASRGRSTAMRERARADRAQLSAQQALTAQVSAERDLALGQVGQLRDDRQAMQDSYRLLSLEVANQQTEAIEHQAAQRLAATEALLTPMRHGLERLDARLASFERDRASLTASLSEQVRAVQQAESALSRQTADLVGALRRPQVRGSWGELQLKRAVELAGMIDHCDFQTQATSAGADHGLRPDMRVDLAGGKFIYVDAKTPLTAFLNAQDSSDEVERATALADLARHLRRHIDQLSAKGYWKAEADTPEFVVLFLPSEALASTALEQAPDLIEYAAARNVILATGTTLIAMLRAVAYAWDQETLRQSTREISEIGRQLYDRLGVMISHVAKLGRSIEASAQSYNALVGSLESRVLVSARRLAELRVSDQDLPPLGQVTSGVRQVSLSEPDPVSAPQ